MAGSTMKPVHPEFEKIIESLQKDLEAKTGIKYTFTELTLLYAEMNKPIINIPKELPKPSKKKWRLIE